MKDGAQAQNMLSWKNLAEMMSWAKERKEGIKIKDESEKETDKEKH